MDTGFQLTNYDGDNDANNANDDSDANDDKVDSDDNDENDVNDEDDIVNKNLPSPAWGLVSWWTQPALSGRPSSGISCLKNGWFLFDHVFFLGVPSRNSKLDLLNYAGSENEEFIRKRIFFKGKEEEWWRGLT